MTARGKPTAEKEALGNCPLFAGLASRQLDDAVAFWDGMRRTYRKGEYPLPPGKTMARFGLVLSGAVQVLMDDMDGRHLIMADVSAGGTFGESLCYLGVKDSPVYVRAATDATILWMSADHVRRMDARGGFEDDCTRRFIGMLAARTLSMNDRIQVLSKRGLREKLTTFFAQCAARAGDRLFTVTLSREDMAVYLGVNRSALSRELSAMRGEGLIDYTGNRFTYHPSEK